MKKCKKYTANFLIWLPVLRGVMLYLAYVIWRSSEPRRDCGKGIWQAENAIPAATWWKELCANRSLALLANRVLALPASSASAETGVHISICIVPREIALLTLRHIS